MFNLVLTSSLRFLFFNENDKKSKHTVQKLKSLEIVKVLKLITLKISVFSKQTKQMLKFCNALNSIIFMTTWYVLVVGYDET